MMTCQTKLQAAVKGAASRRNCSGLVACVLAAAYTCAMPTPAAAQYRPYQPAPIYQPIPVPAPPRDLGQSYRDSLRSIEPPARGSTYVCTLRPNGDLDCVVR